MEILVLVSYLVQVQQRLVNRLLELKGRLHGFQTAAPLVFGRPLDVLEHDAAAAVVLKFHQCSSML